MASLMTYALKSFKHASTTWDVSTGGSLRAAFGPVAAQELELRTADAVWSQATAIVLGTGKITVFLTDVTIAKSYVIGTKGAIEMVLKGCAANNTLVMAGNWVYVGVDTGDFGQAARHEYGMKFVFESAGSDAGPF